MTACSRRKQESLPSGSSLFLVTNALFGAGDKLSRLSGEAEEQSEALQASHEQAAQLESEIDRLNRELQAAKQQVKAVCTSCLSKVVVQSFSARLVMHRT